MDERIAVIIEKIRGLEEELEQELSQATSRLSYRIEKKKILFEKSIVEYHRKLKKNLYRFIREASLLNVLTAPVIYAMAPPIFLLDLCVTIFQFICFPAYGLKKVPRGDFIAIDRHNLAYLNVIEKINCAYCGYANGVAAYFREVAARTEEYWCPIKHAKKVKNPHSKYHRFEEYGDADRFRGRMNKNGKS